jgi:M6 family metalloprotease-like protein
MSGVYREHYLSRMISLIGFCLMAIWLGTDRPAVAQQTSLSGWFHVIWGDGPPGSNITDARPVLIDDQGRWTGLLLDEGLVRPSGGILAFDRKRVTIVGGWESQLPSVREGFPFPQRRFQVDLIQFEPAENAEAVAPDATPLAITGAQKWVTILCRFGDSTNVTPHPRSWFNTLMGTAYPGMDHYWRELSYGNITLTGSVVVGWYNLPQPRSYYVYDWDGDGNPDTADLNKAVNDCTAVADAAVFFPAFSGINLMFNQDLDCCAWGGGATLTRDGQTKFYSVTWMPPWGHGNQGVVGHEMGHGFGLPHSSGPYGATYDSRWDVMSNIWGNCSPPHPAYGCVGVHTISYHKDMLGWIPAARKYVPAPGSTETIVLERLGQPVSGSNYLMAQIPIGSSTSEFYTVEARRFAGYDTQIPGEAIVIHRVNWQAQVVDPDSNGDPNDAGAMWLPGDTFVDTANSITVEVDAATPTGFVVTIGLQGCRIVNPELPIAAVTASGWQEPNRPTNTLDGDLGTRWSAQGDGQWIEYDLGSANLVSQVAIAWYQGNRRTSRFDIQLSTDRAGWMTVCSGSSSGRTLDLEAYAFADMTARYVRIVGHGSSQGNWNSITEVAVYEAGDASEASLDALEVPQANPQSGYILQGDE